MKFFYKLFFITFILTNFTNAQIKGVGIGMKDTREVSASAILHLKSEDKALYIARIESVDKIRNPAPGMVVFNKQEKCLSLYNGHQWSCICTSCGQNRDSDK